MSTFLSGSICVYASPKLTGRERPEHVVPAGINGRIKTHAACDDCNTWAGEHVDQPWLGDAMVLHLRFDYGIPDRRGNKVESDPLLTGMTEDGRRLTLGRDGRPKQVNTPVIRDESKREFQISAPDREQLDKQIDKELRRYGKTRHDEDVELPEPQTAQDRPPVSVKLKIYPGKWERMAAKITLGLLAEEQPEAWRQGRSAELLRERMHDLDRAATEVPLTLTDSVETFASAPCTTVVVTSRGGGPAAFVTLLGAFTITLPLGEDLRDYEHVWVCDPLDPTASASGSLAEVVGQRLGFADAA